MQFKIFLAPHPQHQLDQHQQLPLAQVQHLMIPLHPLIPVIFVSCTIYFTVIIFMNYTTCSSIYNILQHAMMMNTKDTTVTTLTVTTN